jgi:hypothetical protein
MLGVFRSVRHDGPFQRPRVSQLLVGEFGSLEIGFLEVGALEVSSFEISLAEVGLLEISLL